MIVTFQQLLAVVLGFLLYQSSSKVAIATIGKNLLIAFIVRLLYLVQEVNR